MDTLSPSSTEKVVEAVLAYYHLALAYPSTMNDALTWYDTLSPDAQQMLVALPTYEWFLLPDFKRYQLERRGIFLHTYLASQLTPHEFEHWRLHGDGGIGDGFIVAPT